MRALTDFRGHIVAIGRHGPSRERVAQEPGRAGKIAFVAAGAPARTLGRALADEPGSVVFQRQRPGALEPQPPLEGAGISRRQLGLRAKAGVRFAERLGSVVTVYT